MKTRIPSRLQNSERLQSVQVRQPAVRLRGSIAVAVASIAAPSPRASEASSSNAIAQPSISAEHEPSHSTSADVVRATSVAPLSTPGAGGGDISSEHAAKLERAASSGHATTSSSVVSSTSTSSGYQRRRFSGTAGKGTTGPEGRFSGVGRGGARSFVRDNEFQPREFTAQLTAASSVAELQQLFDAGCKHDINAIHIATLWTRLAKLVCGPPPRALERGGPGPIDVRGAPRAPAAATQRPEPAALLAFVDALEAATTAEQLAEMAPRGLANVVWAAAKLKPESPTSAGAGSSGNSSGSSGEAQAELLAEGEHERAAAVAEAEASSPEEAGTSGAADSERPRPLRVRGGRKALAAAAAEKQAAEAEAAGRLSSTVVSEALLDAWAAAAGRKLSGFSMQDISNVVWALGRLGYQPRGMFMTQLSIALLKELPRADRAQQVSNVLLGLALLRYTPPIKDFWPPVWEAVTRLVLAEQREQPDVQGVTNTLWALSQLLTECPNTMPAVPSALISKAVFRAVQYGDRLSGPQCQDVFMALPRLGFEPSEYQSSKLLALALRLLPSCDAQALSNIMVSLVALRVRPWRAWKAAARDAFRQQLQTASPEAAARFLFAWAHMHEAPPVWSPQVWDKLHREVDRLTASDIAFVVLGANQMFERLPRRAAKDAGDAEDAGATAGAKEAEAEAAAPQAQQPQQPQQEDAAKEQEQTAEANVDPTTAAVSSSTSSTSVAAAGAGSPEAAETEAPRRRRALSKDAVASFKARLPSRRFLLALRDRWEAVGAEAQLSVVLNYRALVQQFFDALEA
ncbi:hypothetical protein PLESTB_000562100 [Pleodorina starrii]|uniref:Uncharacterized protein n=1 Tax=Pleodorina starrii TaxID=330485 RepID=A0A9W6F0K1_9CHLO|nr:hypothetical protein PLESTM_000287200 [Pleodorina starrii]GLC51912.1 hypothetical protein PLESTB_000562100 [Pleodorina starrii]GLC74593.1 hypothetical protein PLESTF_001530900 [Pleodorina starrii]